MEDSLLGAAARQTLAQPTVLEMVTGSGPVVQAVLYLLVLFSVISWAIVFFKFRQLRRTRRESEQFTVVFWETKNLSSIHTASLEMKESVTAQIFRAGYQELMRITRARKQPQDPAHKPDSFEDIDEGGVENVERGDASGRPGTGDPAGERSDFFGHHRRYRPFHRSVWHGVGDYERLPGPGLKHRLNDSGGRARHRRGSDCHRHRPGRSDSVGRGL